MSMQWIGDYLSLTRRLWEARRASGMTELQAARLLGISEQTFRGWEAGQADIAASGLFLLAHRLGVRVYDPAHVALRKEVA